MKLQVQCKLNYQTQTASTAIFSLLAAKTAKQTILSENLQLDPELAIEEMASVTDGHRFLRLEIPEEKNFTLSYEATVETQCIEFKINREAPSRSVGQLPGDVLPYLFPSRYCQSDQLLRFAYHRFGHLETEFDQVLAITDWVYANVEYLSGSSTTQTAALDTITQQAGVCRDFAHLAIALCRALTIPARYFTCYAYQLHPADFHACFEAYLQGQWIIFDATRLAPLNGLVKIASGRDAADVAVANLFGTIFLNTIKVSCQHPKLEFSPFYYSHESPIGLVY